MAAHEAEIGSNCGRADSKKSPNAIQLKFKFKALMGLGNKDEILDNVTCWESWYLFRRIKDAFLQISWYMDDEVVNDIWDGLGRITVKPCFMYKEDEDYKNPSHLSDGDYKAFEVKKMRDRVAKLILYLPLGYRGYDMCYSEYELTQLFLFAGYMFQPDKKEKLLLGVANAAYWRGYWFLQKMLTEGIFYMPTGAAKEAIDKCLPKCTSESVVKAWPVKYVRKNGYRRDGVVVLTRQAFWTFDVDSLPHAGEPIRHELSQVICYDYLPGKSMIPGSKEEFTLRIYSSEPPPEDPTAGCKMPCACKIHAPKINLPSINLPKFDLPSIPKPSFPEIPMPSVPEMPKLFTIDIHNPFRREKKKIPPRWHPDVKESNFCQFIPTDGDENMKKLILQEIAWATYVMQAWNSGGALEPFYPDYPGSDAKKATQDVPMFRPGCCSLM